MNYYKSIKRTFKIKNALGWFLLAYFFIGNTYFGWNAKPINVYEKHFDTGLTILAMIWLGLLLNIAEDYIKAKVLSPKKVTDIFSELGSIFISAEEELPKHTRNVLCLYGDLDSDNYIVANYDEGVWYDYKGYAIAENQFYAITFWREIE